jgi:predicted dehydrogenase
MTTAPVKLGIVSFAHHHAGFYMSSLAGRADVDVMATDPHGSDAIVGRESRGPALAERFGVGYVNSYDELLAWGPDAVLVCSENTRHAEDVIAAAQAGAHVLVEKPMATSVADAQRMIDTCDRAGVVLMVSYPIRFTPMYLAMRDAVRRGDIGTIMSATGTNNGKLPMGGAGWFTDPSLSGGGALMDLVVHVADLLDDLLDGAQASTVYAASNRVLHADNPLVAVETGGLVTISYPGGQIATIDCSWSEPEHSPNWGGLTLEVVGTQGVAEMDPFAPRVGGFDNANRKEFWLSFGVDSTVPLIDEFLSAISAGREPRPNGRTGLRSLAIADAAQRSAACGQPVHL